MSDDLKERMMEGCRRRQEAIERLRDQLGRQQAARDELAIAQQMLIAVSLNLNTGDLPSELHNMLDDYVEQLEREVSA